MKFVLSLKPVLFALASVAFVAVSGCATLDAQSSSCTVPQTRNAEAAFAQTRSMLEKPACAASFDQQFENLLNVTEANPGAANNQRFSDFLTWAADQGVIGKLQAKQRYTSYFSRTFASLPDSYSNCSSTCPIVAVVQANLRDELIKKERGSRILDDKQLLKDAHQDATRVQVLLEATCVACQTPGS